MKSDKVQKPIGQKVKIVFNLCNVVQLAPTVEHRPHFHLQDDDGGLVAGEEETAADEDAERAAAAAAAAAEDDDDSTNTTTTTTTTERAQLEFTHHVYEEYLPSLPRESKPPIIIQTVPHYQVGQEGASRKEQQKSSPKSLQTLGLGMILMTSK